MRIHSERLTGPRALSSSAKSPAVSITLIDLDIRLAGTIGGLPLLGLVFMP